ncbi:MAG: hypothetical protein ABI399_00950 [Bauldia sp.]
MTGAARLLANEAARPSPARGLPPAMWIAAPLAAALVVAIWTLMAQGVFAMLLAPVPGSRVALPTVDGAWLSNLVVQAAGALPWPLDAKLTLISALVIGFLLAWLHVRLVRNGWPVVEALCLVLILAGHAVVIGAVIADHRVIPVMLACAAVVPAIRRLESVGDVQAEMSFGLVLPLLFLAGPTMTLLVPMLAIFGAVSDREARSDLRAFVAMFLVAILPTLLIVTGMFGMVGGAEAVRLFHDVYLARFRAYQFAPDAVAPLLMTTAATILPFGLVIAAYCLQPDRRRQVWSAIAVIALPGYLIAGAFVFHWPMLVSTPAAVCLAAFASWLSVARLSPVVRRASILLVLLVAAVSWTTAFQTVSLRTIDVATPR